MRLYRYGLHLALVGCVLSSGCLLNRDGSSFQEDAVDGGGSKDATQDLSVNPWVDGSTQDDAEVGDASAINDGETEHDVIIEAAPDATQDHADVSPPPDTGPTPVGKPSGYPCGAVPFVPNYQPVIDGQLDTVFQNLLVSGPPGDMSQLLWIKYNDDKPSAVTFQIAIAVVSRGVWFYVDVHDDHLRAPKYAPQQKPWAPWNGDSVELYLDMDGLFPKIPGYDDPGTVQFIIPVQAAGQAAPFAHRYVNAVYESPPEHDEDWVFGPRATIKPSGTGYVFEGVLTPQDVGLPAALPGTPAPAKIGFDIAVNSCERPDNSDICNTPADSSEDYFGQTTVAGQFLYHCIPDGSGGCQCEPFGNQYCFYGAWATTRAFCTPDVVSPDGS